jgi:hypothetical protein
MGFFITDGLRSACGGGNDTKRRGWIEGSVEWYHTVGQSSLPKDAAACQHALELLDEQHSNWRALLAPLLELLYVAQQRSFGPVLDKYQTHIASLPGLSELRVNSSIPYQHFDGSLNANVNAHIDTNDLIGTTIWWLCFMASNGLLASSSGLGGVFLLCDDLGMKFGIGHLTHIWCRSDSLVHGTVLNAGVTTDKVSSCLCGMAFANHRMVTHAALKVFNEGGLKTWQRQRETDASALVCILPRDLHY